MASTEAQKKASAAWTKGHVKTVTIGFNKDTEADMIEWLTVQPNMTKAIKDAIRSIMGR